MIRLILLLLLLCTLSLNRSQGQAASTEAETRLKVLCWNIQLLPNGLALFSKHLRKAQKVRLPWIIEHCQQSDYEVIVFQEVFDVQLRRKLRHKLRKAYPYQVKPKGKFLRYSSGILILSRLPMKALGHVTFPPGITADKMAAKGCMLVEVNKNGKKIQLGGTHLQAGGSEREQNIRQEQYLRIRKLFDGHLQAEIPQVLLGDLNTEQHLRPRYEAMLQTLDMHDTPLLDSLPFTICKTNTWNAHEPACQLDYILLGKKWPRLKLHRLEILRLKGQHKGKTMDYADHYGLIGELGY
jgi:endonuclease/exonuclease/phosphatase family metal-dependent hydrolase